MYFDFNKIDRNMFIYYSNDPKAIKISNYLWFFINIYIEQKLSVM